MELTVRRPMVRLTEGGSASLVLEEEQCALHRQGIPKAATDHRGETRSNTVYTALMPEAKRFQIRRPQAPRL